MKIGKKHPRYFSLFLREKLVRSMVSGITSRAGLIAHGRGEAFDYLLGEKTHVFALNAIKAACALLLTSKKPIISVNGNTTALCAEELVQMAEILDCKIEVNLFHFSLLRVKKIEKHLKKLAKDRVLSYEKRAKIKLPDIASKRAIVIRSGIGDADCVLVPLEDGDRCEALVSLGKKVITVDLNPLSRTARAATVTIVDNIVRVLPILNRELIKLKNEKKEILFKIIESYNNKKTLLEAIRKIRYDINQ